MQSERDRATAEFTIEREPIAELGAATERQYAKLGAVNEKQEPAAASRILDDQFPPRIRRKYYLKASEHTAEIRIYADEKGEYLAFKDSGCRLATRLDNPEVIRDMIVIAEHRGWHSLQVRGSEEFRREAWLGAKARGLEVTGYEPTDIDRQALEKRREAQRQKSAREQPGDKKPERTSERTREAPPSPTRLDYEKGVEGRLAEVGTAPYKHREGAERSAYIVLELEDGRRHQMWGVSLGRAVEESEAKTGDWVRVRRDGVEVRTKDIRVISPEGSTSVERRNVRQNQWTVTADKFRTLDRKEAVKDPTLAAAHSHLAVLERALERIFPGDRQAYDAILQVARERIVQHLEQGHTFARAEYSLPERTSGNENREHWPRQTEPERGKVRTRERER